MRTTTRKPHVKVEQHYYLDFLRDYGSHSLYDLATTFDVSETTAKRKLDGLIGQGKVSSHREFLANIHEYVTLYHAVEGDDAR
jgi:DeoR/GlpR family transcriptional regulator of sugar metabolism